MPVRGASIICISAGRMSCAYADFQDPAAAYRHPDSVPDLAEWYLTQVGNEGRQQNEARRNSQ
jgi:hypothetical protein